MDVQLEITGFLVCNDAQTPYFEQGFCAFYKRVSWTVYAEIRKHGLLMTSLLENRTRPTCQEITTTIINKAEVQWNG